METETHENWMTALADEIAMREPGLVVETPLMDLVGSVGDFKSLTHRRESPSDFRTPSPSLDQSGIT